MKKILKYGVFPIMIFLFLLVMTVMLMPVIINVQKYVPDIEKSISKATGRPFSIGPDVAISFFPCPSLTFSDLKLGNPKGFASDALVKIDSFEMQIKVLPLFRNEIQVGRFVVGGLEINLERAADGRKNWGSVNWAAVDRLQNKVLFNLLALSNGRLNWIDRKAKVRHTVENLMLMLSKAEADRPFDLDVKAVYDGKPLTLSGKAGPLQQAQGKESLPLDLGFRLVETLRGQVRGSVENWHTAPACILDLTLAEFAPRELASALGFPFPFHTADPQAFRVMDLDLPLKLMRNELAIDKAVVRLDDAKLAMSGAVKNLQKPEANFSLEIDSLDLDRYLPVAQPSTEPDKNRPHSPQAGAVMAAFTRHASLAGLLKIGTLKAYGATASSAEANIKGADGVISLDNATMQLYGGQVQANLTANLAAEMPKLQIAMQANGVDAGAMLQAMNKRELLTGSLKGDFSLEYPVTHGASKMLGGMASFSLLDGALMGLDLDQSLQRREVVEAGATDDPKSVRTDFSELQGKLDIQGGLIKLGQASLVSPVTSLTASGEADLSGRKWQLRVSQQNQESKQGKAKAQQPLMISGKLDMSPDNRRQVAMGTVDGAKANVAGQVDGKNSPTDADAKDLVGKPLVDPAVVAQRFHPQPQLGSGKIRINPLQESIASP